jgi:integrase
LFAFSPLFFLHTSSTYPSHFSKPIQDWCIRVIGKVAPKTASVYIAGVKSWLEHKGVNPNLLASVKVPHQNSTPTVDDEEVPSQERLRQILNYADERQRSIIALIAFSGIRFETMSRLKISDLIEAQLTSEGIRFPKYPMIIHCGPEATKKDNRYFTLLIREGCEYLKAYIDRRVRQGEKLTAGSPVISSDDKRYRGKALTSHQLSELVRKCFDDAGFKARPYVLRGFFDTAMLSAKNLKHTWQQFFMGHRGDIEGAVQSSGN